jgi:hypothetical protein
MGIAAKGRALIRRVAGGVVVLCLSRVTRLNGGDTTTKFLVAIALTSCYTVRESSYFAVPECVVVVSYAQ